MLALAVSRIQELPAVAFDHAALPTTDQQRLATLVRPARRRQFLAVRFLARQLLEQQFGAPARQWTISTRADGSPGVDGHPETVLSLTHSGDWVACAVADQPVGIDLEIARRDARRDLDGMAAVVFSEFTRRHLSALAEPARPLAFLQHWTLAEAWCKQRRHGLDFQQTRALCFEPAESGPARTWSRTQESGALVVLALICAQTLLDEFVDPGAGWCGA